MVPVLAVAQVMHSALIVVIVFTVISFITSVLVIATLAISSRISQEEAVEQPMDVMDVDHLMRFPHGR